jgi:hypothetical protein
MIIPEGGYNEVGIDLVIQKIRSLVPREGIAGPAVSGPSVKVSGRQ